MLKRQFLWVLATAIVLAVPGVVHAQEATVTGTITDSTGGVLPGVTVTATNEESGNTFVAVTDGEGRFRLPLRIGSYRIAAELAGFATVTRTGLQMQVGQLATVNLQMAPSNLSETLTVTGEAPLINTTMSTAASNIDQRQMQELPLNGRNWLDLTLLAPGSRANQGGETPIPRSQVAFQINMDGQQVTNSVAGAGFGQPRFSRDSIAEFEFITNRFDATQGRSMGVVVNAVTKSGTNTSSGTFSGYFRDSDWAAKDHAENRVIPFSNQQYSATFGGPIKRDRIHYFGNYEYEREPQTAVYSGPFPQFNVDLHGIRTQSTAGLKTDFQFTPKTHMSARVNGYTQFVPLRGAGGATTHPSGASQWWRTSTQYWDQLTHVLSNNKVNELKGGVYMYDWDIASLASFRGGPTPNFPGGTYPVISSHTLPKGAVLNAGNSATLGGSPRIQLAGYNIGTPTNLPQMIGQRTIQARDDFTMSFNAKGRHDVRMGGEFLEHNFHFYWCSNCNGNLQSNAGGTSRRPNAAQLAAMFPDPFDWSTWNYNALSPLSARYRQSVGDFRLINPRHALASWYQDDWRVTPRLTLNLGVRWDADIGVMGEKKKLTPWMSGDRPHQLDWFAPRVGLAYQLSERTVLRGGYGKYYTQLENDAAHQSNLNIQTIIPEVANDGRVDFAMNPFGGAFPTVEQARARLCTPASPLAINCIRREITSEIPTTVHNDTYSHQAMVSFARQLAANLAVDISYQYTGQRREEVTNNQNLRYDPATGDNIPFNNIAARIYPEWGFVNGEYMQGWSNWHALVMSVDKRFSNRWQLSGNYTLGAVKDSQGPPCQTVVGSDGNARCERITFPLKPDVQGEYSYAATDQRHRAVLNGIWDVGHGFQLSGLYFYGSGMRTAVTCGSCQVRDTGSTNGTRRRDDGSVIERNSFVGTPLHRVDVRFQQRIGLGGRRSIDGIFEVFNLLDHSNFGSFTNDVDSTLYGTAVYNDNVVYQARSVQLGFRIAF
ncbi:MAG TPA: TonB-dependent receptor [Vicinamibacterales bacterium]